MARKTHEEKLTEEISILDDTLYTLEQPEMNHIKEVYFNQKGEHFFTARKFDGKLFTRLGLKAMDVTGGKQYPDDSIVAYKPEEGSPSTITVYCQLDDKSTHIVKTLPKDAAIKHFQKLYDSKKAELDALIESKRPVIKETKKAKLAA